MARAVGVVSREELVAGDGLSFLRGIIAGTQPAPPFADAMDFELVEAEHRGNTVVTTEGRLVDARGKLLAHGTETCLVFPGKAANG